MNNAIQNKEKLVSGYYRFSKAWYATDRDMERSTIMIGMYYPDGSTNGEISVEWEAIQDRKVPKLSAYDDGWKVLSTFTRLLKELGKWDNHNITEKQFVQLLDKAGFTDLTPYTQSLKTARRPRTILLTKSEGLKK